MTPDLEPTANRAPRHPVQRFIKRQHCLASMVSKDQVRGQKSRNKLNRRVAPGCHALRSVIYSERRTSQKASERESQRDSALKPRVASSELPWETSGVDPLNLEEVAPTPRMINPIRRDCGMALFLLMAQLPRS